MGHFAELDQNNIVVRICVVDNDYIPNDRHPGGIAWCENFWGGRWIQTAYNGRFGKRFAGIGYTYLEPNGVFITPQPYPSWSLNPQKDDWIPPVPYPTDGSLYYWDENLLNWVEQP